jgi:hypothetical protein
MAVLATSRMTFKATVLTCRNGPSAMTVSWDLILCRPLYPLTNSDLKLDLVTATAAVAAFSSILFGLFTNLPVALG